jgi:uncharacterized RDD family membrane protein YckC
VTRIRLFGSIHYNTRSIVEDDLEAFAEGADAIAIENSRFGRTPQEIALVMLQFPFLTLSWHVYALLGSLLAILFNRDLLATEQAAALSVAGEREVHSVDRHPIALLAEGHPGWAILDWLAFIVITAIWPVSVLATIGIAAGLITCGVIRKRYDQRGVAVAGVLLVELITAGLLLDSTIDGRLFLVGMLATVVLARRTVAHRDEVMLADVARLAEAHDYDRICLTTGYGHVPGMVERAADHGLVVDTVFKQRWRDHGEWLTPEIVRENTESGQLPHESLASEPLLETAGDVFGKRLLATGIDLAIVGYLWSAVIVFGQDWFGISFGPLDATLLSDPIRAAMYAGLLLLGLLYHFGTETVFGRTAGKRFAGIAAVSTDGSPCTTGQSLLRTLSLPLDFLPAGFLFGGMSVAASGRGQRLGDRLAGTMVVELALPDEATPETAGDTDQSSSQTDEVPSGRRPWGGPTASGGD